MAKIDDLIKLAESKGMTIAVSDFRDEVSSTPRKVLGKQAILKGVDQLGNTRILCISLFDAKTSVWTIDDPNLERMQRAIETGRHQGPA